MNKKVHLIIRILAAVLAITWMFRIFSFSSDEASVSGTVSRSMSYNLMEKISRHLHLGWDEDRIEAVSKPVEKYLRKAAHMYEYAVLAFLWGVALDSFGIGMRLKDQEGMKSPPRDVRAWSRSLLPLLICLAYASSDEIHQTFVEGRSGEVRDVMLDTCGAVIGLVFGLFVTRIAFKFFRKRS